MSAQVGGPGTVVLPGGGSGSSSGEAVSVQGSATLPATCTEKDLYQDTNSGGTEFYVCTAANTWTQAGTGTIGGTLTATDDLLTCTDGTGGSTIGACTVGNIDNLRLDGNTISSTNTNGNLVLAPNGTGSVVAPAGTVGVPSLLLSGDTATGWYRVGANAWGFSASTSQKLQMDGNAMYFFTWFLKGQGTAVLDGFKSLVTASTSGSGAPHVVQVYDTGQLWTNEGATAENYHTLPTAVAGYTVTFVVQDADGIRITAAAGDTIRPIAGTAASAAAGFIRCATQGAFITLVAINATEWVAIGSAGTWTIDV